MGGWGQRLRSNKEKSNRYSSFSISAFAYFQLIQQMNSFCGWTISVVKEKQNAQSMGCGILQCYYTNRCFAFSRSFQFNLDHLQRRRRGRLSLTTRMSLYVEKLLYEERLKHLVKRWRKEGMGNVHHLRYSAGEDVTTHRCFLWKKKKKKKGEFSGEEKDQ